MEEQKKLKLNNNKGITLVALVVTIIVLIILATVSINLVMGENGLIKQAERAADAQANAEKQSHEALDIYSNYLEEKINKKSNQSNQNTETNSIEEPEIVNEIEPGTGGEEDPVETIYESTAKGVVQAAKDAGLNMANVYSLENFFSENGKEFTSSNFNEFINACNEIKNKVTNPLANTLFKSTAAELTEEERCELYDEMEISVKSMIYSALHEMANKYNISISIVQDGNGYPLCIATMD